MIAQAQPGRRLYPVGEVGKHLGRDRARLGEDHATDIAKQARSQLDPRLQRRAAADRVVIVVQRPDEV